MHEHAHEHHDEDHDSNRWAVAYFSAGCIPDSDPVTFDDPDDARVFVREEWEALAQDCPEWTTDSGAWTPAALEALQAIDGLGMRAGSANVSDPRPGSLYRWELSLRCHRCGNTNVRPPAGYRLALCMGGCGTAFDTMG